MDPIEQDHLYYMHSTAEILDEIFDGYGFALFVFDFGEGGKMNFISNAERISLCNSLIEFVYRTEQEINQYEHTKKSHLKTMQVNDVPPGRSLIASYKNKCVIWRKSTLTKGNNTMLMRFDTGETRWISNKEYVKMVMTGKKEKEQWDVQDSATKN